MLLLKSFRKIHSVVPLLAAAVSSGDTDWHTCLISLLTSLFHLLSRCRVLEETGELSKSAVEYASTFWFVISAGLRFAGSRAQSRLLNCWWPIMATGTAVCHEFLLTFPGLTKVLRHGFTAATDLVQERQRQDSFSRYSKTNYIIPSGSRDMADLRKKKNKRRCGTTRWIGQKSFYFFVAALFHILPEQHIIIILHNVRRLFHCQSVIFPLGNSIL